ncbi:MAG: type II toxin-antitoxin system RelE/ParE family toxin [Nitriliruptorales bacterium]|nr:type II toxin-antitoxin system RelE/ParE family toxin [Nitriliruptorales bacterium]
MDMGYEVELETAAAKSLSRIPAGDRRRLTSKINALAADPRPDGCTKLSGFTNAWRVRVGNYRIVYIVDDTVRVVTITRIGKREDIYRRRR